jgi:hypothetical protein
MVRLFVSTVLATIALTAGAVAQPADAWEIGPVVRGRNHSVGMPRTLSPGRSGATFTFPSPGGSVHYVTIPTERLTGATRIAMRYRIDAAPGTRFVPVESPELPATISLNFQRRGDTWSGKRSQHYRWYAPYERMSPVAPGEYQVSISLRDPDWISVYGKRSRDNPEALADVDRVGFVFGSGAGRGHGVYAIGNASFTLLDFRVL